MDRAGKGLLAESMALGFFKLCGYECLARRWRRAEGEVDLVVARPGLLVFVEVKMRGPGSLGSAGEAVRQYQLKRLRRLAHRWCHEHPSGRVQLRLDVVTIDLAGEGRGLVIRHFPGAG